MSEEINELDELISYSSSVNVNIVTLNDAFLERVKHALKTAKELRKVVVLDPEGCGATMVRTTASQKLIQYADVVRGNASEIISLDNNNKAKTLGVESQNATFEAKESANSLAEQYDITVVISGSIDVSVKKGSIRHLSFGLPLMQHITGMGCVLSSIIAAFCSVETYLFQASLLATAFYSVCGEHAAQKTSCSGSFRVVFLDALYNPDFDFMEGKVMKYKALSIAGFDGSGGAGIQADLKVFSAFGCYGMTVLTALPVQNTTGVKNVTRCL